jgi:hypothetical protein
MSGKNAIAIQLYLTEDNKWDMEYIDNFFYMTITLVRSIREVGNDCDIIVITNIDRWDHELQVEGIIKEKREIFDFPTYHQDSGFKKSTILLYDMQKIQYWSLTDYDKVIGLDNDILAIKKFDQWNAPELGVLFLKMNGSINSGMLYLEPSKETFDSMFDIVQNSTFSIETGWNDCGPIGAIDDWKFYGANVTQGFIPYFFRSKMSGSPYLQGYFKHYSGTSKYKDPNYIREIERNGFKFKIPV